MTVRFTFDHLLSAAVCPAAVAALTLSTVHFLRALQKWCKNLKGFDQSSKWYQKSSSRAFVQLNVACDWSNAQHGGVLGVLFLDDTQPESPELPL